MLWLVALHSVSLAQSFPVAPQQPSTAPPVAAPGAPAPSFPVLPSQVPAAQPLSAPPSVMSAPMLLQTEAASVWPDGFDKGWAWKAVGPPGARKVISTAIHPERSDIWALATDVGSVWITLDGGKSWLEVLRSEAGTLGPTSSDEDALLQVEAAVNDLLESGADDSEDAAELANGAIQEALDGVQADLDGTGAWFEEAGAAAGTALVKSRVFFTPAGVLVSSRSDGLRVSVDLGASWTKTVTEPVSAFASLSRNFHLIGTASGLKFSEDMRNWAPVVEVSDTVYDLVVDNGVYAATDKGLWFAPEGWVFRKLQSWTSVSLTARPVAGPLDEDVRAPRALVLGAAAGIKRSLGPMEALAVDTIGGPVPSSRSIARLNDKLLLATSSDGPFQSVDQGATWRPISSGLADPSTWSISHSDDGVLLLASAGGLYRMSPADKPPPQVSIPPWITLNALMESSLGRRELRQFGGSRVLAALLPQLQLNGIYRIGSGNDWRPDTGTERTEERDYGATVTLTWTPNRGQSSQGFDSESLPVVSLGGSATVLDNSALIAGYSVTRRGSVSYRSQLAKTINQLYMDRARLMAEKSVSREENLLQVVTRDLQVAEVEAQLDALTDGAVSSWRGDPNNQPAPDESMFGPPTPVPGGG